MNKLFYGDNLDILRRFVDPGSVDLCYIDPPFNSKRNYNQIYNNIGEEDRAQAQAFVDTWTWDDHAIECLDIIQTNRHGTQTKQSIELIKGLFRVLGKGSLLAYLVSMTVRLAEIRRVLKDTGSFFLHCDPTASHYLKLICDGIFVAGGGGGFRNEIIWCYTGPGSPGMRQFMRKHDVIFWYSKGNEWTFNADDVRVTHSNKTKANYKPGLVGSGFVDAEHKIHEKGKIPEDWWEYAIAPRGKEYLGYPTQKPEALLERIIKAASSEDDLILDAYCGCGTTIAMAQKHKRRWIGIDITYQSIAVIIRRLEKTFNEFHGEGDPRNFDIKTQIELHGVPRDMEAVDALINKKDDRLRKEFEKWAVLTYSENRAIIHEKKGADKGIDGIAYIRTKKDEVKSIIISVKSGANVGRKEMAELRGTIERENAAAGIMILRNNPTRPMELEAKEAGKYRDTYLPPFDRLQIVTVQEILGGKRMNLPLTEEVVRKAQKAIAETQPTLALDAAVSEATWEEPRCAAIDPDDDQTF